MSHGAAQERSAARGSPLLRATPPITSAPAAPEARLATRWDLSLRRMYRRLIDWVHRITWSGAGTTFPHPLLVALCHRHPLRRAVRLRYTYARARRGSKGLSPPAETPFPSHPAAAAMATAADLVGHLPSFSRPWPFKQVRRIEMNYNKENSMMDSEGSAPKKAKEYLSTDVTATSGKHYLCGCCAAFTNIAITFPIQKVLFRQQLYGLKTKDAVHQLQKDGIRNLYRGILPPLMQKTTTLALMFGLYEDVSSLLHSHTNAPELVTCSMAAVLAGTTEAVLTPFERVQTLLQDYKHHDKFTNTYQAFKALKVYGVREYYRGLVPILLRNGPSNVLFFGLRGPIKQCLPEATSYSTHLVNDFICGGLLGAMLGFLFFPVNVVKTRMQAQIGGEFQSFSKVFVKIWLERDRKLIHLFRGAHLNYHRSLLSWGIINATYEFLLKLS